MVLLTSAFLSVGMMASRWFVINRNKRALTGIRWDQTNNRENIPSKEFIGFRSGSSVLASVLKVWTKDSALSSSIHNYSYPPNQSRIVVQQILMSQHLLCLCKYLAQHCQWLWMCLFLQTDALRVKSDWGFHLAVVFCFFLLKLGNSGHRFSVGGLCVSPRQYV